MDKQIVITGAGGFIGKNLEKALSSKYMVYPLAHSNLDLTNIEEVAKFFKDKNVDVIIHCANEGGARKTAYDIVKNNVVENNLRMFFNIIKVLKPDVKLIYFGSGAEYCKQRELNNISEAEFGVQIPKDSYGFSKFIMSNLAKSYENITEFRIFGVYGRYEDYRYKFISNSIVKNLFKMPIVINQNVVFDYLFIDDLVKIVEKFIDYNYKDKIYNITPNDSIDLITIVNIINKISDYKSDIIIKHEGLNNEYTASNSLLKQNIGQYKFASYEQGIKKLYEYYKSIINKIDREEIEKDNYIKYCKNRRDK